MAWQLPWVQPVYGSNVTAIAISHSASQYWISTCDTNFFSCENGAFLLMEATVCWNEVEVIRAKIVVQSVIEQSLLKWNGRDCDSSMYSAIWFYCVVMWQRSEISLILPNFRQQKLPGCFSYGREWGRMQLEDVNVECESYKRTGYSSHISH